MRSTRAIFLVIAAAAVAAAGVWLRAAVPMGAGHGKQTAAQEPRGDGETASRAAVEAAGSLESTGGAKERVPLSLPRTAVQGVLVRARAAAAREELSRETVGELLRESLPVSHPDTRLSPADYEQLTEAVLRIRESRRVLDDVELTRESATVIERYRQQMMEALVEFEAVSGINPSTLPNMLDESAGISSQDDGRDDEIVNEPLSSYPPPR